MAQDVLSVKVPITQAQLGAGFVGQRGVPYIDELGQTYFYTGSTWIVEAGVGGSNKQWVFRRGIGVTIDGTTFDAANDAAGVISGGTSGPWIIRAPSWARAFRFDGCGGGGGGGNAGASGGGGGGAGGTSCVGYCGPVIPAELIVVAVGAGGPRLSATDNASILLSHGRPTTMRAALAGIDLGGGEAGRTGIAALGVGGGQPQYGGIVAEQGANYDPGFYGLSTGIGSSEQHRRIFSTSNVATPSTDFSLGTTGAIFGGANVHLSGNLLFVPGASAGAGGTRTPYLGYAGRYVGSEDRAYDSNGTSGGAGGFTHFCSESIMRGAGRGGDAAQLTNALDGFGRGGGGGGGTAGLGSPGTHGIVILTFLEQPL